MAAALSPHPHSLQLHHSKTLVTPHSLRRSVRRSVRSPTSLYPRLSIAFSLYPGRYARSPIHPIQVADSNSPSVGEEVNGRGQTDLPPLKDLIRIYKDAIQDEDWQSVTELEAKFCALEYQKNELLQQYTQLSMDINSEKNKFLRVKADFDNFRKRTEKDRLTLTSDVQRELIETLLPIVDNFEKAKLFLKPESDKEIRINASYQGIYKQFVEIMRSLKVAVVQTVGKTFDPSLHEAVARVESEEFKEGIVVEESRRGFLLGAQLLRPAKVKVSKGPGPGKAFATAGKPIQSSTSAVLHNEPQTDKL